MPEDDPVIHTVFPLKLGLVRILLIILKIVYRARTPKIKPKKGNILTKIYKHTLSKNKNINELIVILSSSSFAIL